jgi:hypothetical protein
MPGASMTHIVHNSVQHFNAYSGTFTCHPLEDTRMYLTQCNVRSA